MAARVHSRARPLAGPSPPPPPLRVRALATGIWGGGTRTDILWEISMSCDASIGLSNEPGGTATSSCDLSKVVDGSVTLQAVVSVRGQAGHRRINLAYRLPSNRAVSTTSVPGAIKASQWRMIWLFSSCSVMELRARGASDQPRVPPPSDGMCNVLAHDSRRLLAVPAQEFCPRERHRQSGGQRGRRGRHTFDRGRHLGRCRVLLAAQQNGQCIVPRPAASSSSSTTSSSSSSSSSYLSALA